MPAATVLRPGRAAIAAAVATSLACATASAAPPSYLGRPIYSVAPAGLQLPPTCSVEPTWRAPLTGAELEVWVVVCDNVARVWLLKRQIKEIYGAKEQGLRFEVIDERVLPEETAGDTLSVQCTGPDSSAGLVVRGARWRPTEDRHELHLASAGGAMRGDISRRHLVDVNLGSVDCTRFPDREAMMRKLQQSDRTQK